MRALSIRQPYAELILRGIKKIEYRTKTTRIIGERFYIYATQSAGTNRWLMKPVLASADTGRLLPAWVEELAGQVSTIEPEARLPTGVIVGSAVIEKVTAPETHAGGGFYQWHLTDIRRARILRKPKGHPQPVWFAPF